MPPSRSRTSSTASTASVASRCSELVITRCESGSTRTGCTRSGSPQGMSSALQGQNVQVASGVLNQPPVAQPRAFQIAVRTLGRLVDPKEFADIVVKQSATAVVRLKDLGRIELASVHYSTNSYRDLDPAAALAISH